MKSQPYDRNLTTKLLQEIADDSETISAAGERCAEQAAMALDSLALAYEKNEQLANQAQLHAAINELFQQLGNPSAYNAPKFAQQMQRVAKLCQGLMRKIWVSQPQHRMSTAKSR